MNSPLSITSLILLESPMQKNILTKAEFDKMLTKLVCINVFNYLVSTYITVIHYFGNEHFLT